MKSFTFQILQQDNVDIGELKIQDSTYYTTKWFYPRQTQYGISFSDSNEPFQLKSFRLFIENIRKNINCIYYRDHEIILEYKDNTFRIHPDSSQTGFNYDSNLIDFYITGHKEELLETLEQMYTWFTQLL